MHLLSSVLSLVSLCCCGIPRRWLPKNALHTEVGAAYALIGHQRAVCTLHRHVTCLQHVAAVTGLKSLDDALLDQQNGDMVLRVDLMDTLENRVDDSRRKTHCGVVEHQ